MTNYESVIRDIKSMSLTLYTEKIDGKNYMSAKIMDEKTGKDYKNLPDLIDSLIGIHSYNPNVTGESFAKMFYSFCREEVVSQTWALAITSQAILETGWGKHLSSPFNYLGIKGQGIAVKTKEYVNGKWITIDSTFQEYTSPKDCIREYIGLIKRKYHKAYNNHDNPRSYFEGLIQTGEGYSYATDPEYVGKCMNIYNSLSFLANKEWAIC